MTPENAQITFIILFVVACFIWMLSLWFSLRIGEFRRSVWQDYQKFHGPSGEVPCGMPAEEFFTRIKKLMRYQAMSINIVRFSVSEESENSITFEKLGPMACNLPAGLMFTSVNLQMAEQNGQQIVRYQVNQRPVFSVFKKIALGICLFLGISALMILSALIWYFCVQSKNQVARWQVFQMLQISHVLWPPFLLVAISWQMQRGVKFFLENVIEHAADPNVSDAELNVSFTMGKKQRNK